MGDKILTVLLGAVAGLFPLIASAVISAIESRSLRARRNDAVNMAKQRVDFLTAWIKAQESVSAQDRYDQLKQSTQLELEQIRQELQNILIETQPHRPADASKERHILQRVFLFYRPRSLWGWLWHTLFYMSAFGLVALTLLALVSIPSYTGEPGNTLSDLLTSYVVFAVPLAAIAVVMRWVAAYADKVARARILSGATGS